MKFFRLYVVCIFLIIYSYSAFAIDLKNYPIHKLDAAFAINENKSVEYFLEFSLGKSANESINFSIDANSTDIRVFADGNEVNFSKSISNFDSVITIENNRSVKLISLRYNIDNKVFLRDSINFFLQELSFRIPVNKLNVKVILPKGFSLHNREVTPADPDIKFENSRFSLEWSFANVINSNVFSVQFISNSPEEFVAKQILNINNAAEEKYSVLTFSSLIFIVSLALFSMAFLMTMFVYFLRKSKKDILTGFMDDERKAILYLQKHREIWQNKLHHEFNFSRAKVTRIVDKLEKKGLLKKEEYGRTNKLYWLK